jgi:exosome complex RNA-binding protein Rrp4
MVKEYPIVFVRYHLLVAEPNELLKKIGEIIPFDICAGFNGRVWVCTEKPMETVFILGALDRISSLIIKNMEKGDFSGF